MVKLIIPVLLLFFFLVPAAEARSLKPKQVGKAVVAAQSSSSGKIIVTPEFRSEYLNQGKCLRDITNLIQSSFIEPKTKDGFLYLTAIFWSVDSLISLSVLNEKVLINEAAFLQRRAKTLTYKSRKKIRISPVAARSCVFGSLLYSFF